MSPLKQSEIATETSPLLSNSSQANPPSLEPSSHKSNPEGSSLPIADDAVNEASTSEAEDGGDVERQISNAGRQKQYEGIPEIKKILPYTMPALGIGVRASALTFFNS